MKKRAGREEAADTPLDMSDNGRHGTSGPVRPSRLMTATVLFYSFYAITAILYIAASFFPSALNWGFHQFAFLPPPLRWASLAVLCIPLCPPVMTFIRTTVRRLDRLHTGRGTRLLLYAASVIVVAGVLTALRARVNLLGDGTYLIAAFSTMSDLHGVRNAVGNAPLTGFIVYQLTSLMKHLHLADAARLSIAVLSILSGTAALAAAALFSSLLASGRVGRLSVAVLLLAAGAGQLFFGYVELYAFPLLLLILYSCAAYLTIRNRLSVVWTSCVYGVLVASHLGMIWLAPATVYLWIDAVIKRKYAAAAVAIAATAVVTVALMMLCGYPVSYLFSVLAGRDSGGNLLSLFTLPEHWHAYTLFSGWHLLDLVNELAIVSPFMPLFLGCGLCFTGNRKIRSDSALRFSVLLAFCSLAFVTLTNFRIGMSRDWDVCALFMVPAFIAALYLWYRASVPAALREKMVVAAVLLTGVHTLSMAAVNAGERSGVGRFAILPDARLWSREAMAYAWEDLSTYYRVGKDGGNTIRYIEKSLACDSTNARRWMLLTGYYLRTGALRKADRSLMNATLNSVEQARPLIEKAVDFQNRDVVDSALQYYRKALDIEGQATVAYQIGTLLATRKAQYRLALGYFDFAVRSDTAFALAYRNRGLCHMSLREWDAMKSDFERYFTLSPYDPQNPDLRRIIRNHPLPAGNDTVR